MVKDFESRIVSASGSKLPCRARYGLATDHRRCSDDL
jgi:hypothetical protein